MTLYELRILEYFSDGEKDFSGTVIDWREYDYITMYWVNQVRRLMGHPIILIRGHHGPDQTRSAVDWTCPTAPFAKVVMELCRLPTCSFGLYSGRSVHMDSRPYTTFPSRWLAIKPTQYHYLTERRLTHLIGKETENWVYLNWTDPDGKALDALNLIVQLAG